MDKRNARQKHPGTLELGIARATLQHHRFGIITLVIPKPSPAFCPWQIQQSLVLDLGCPNRELAAATMSSCNETAPFDIAERPQNRNQIWP